MMVRRAEAKIVEIAAANVVVEVDSAAAEGDVCSFAAAAVDVVQRRLPA